MEYNVCMIAIPADNDLLLSQFFELVKALPKNNPPALGVNVTLGENENENDIEDLMRAIMEEGGASYVRYKNN